MNTIIRAATADDAEAIAGVMESVWPDEGAQPGRIRDALAHPDHAAFVATGDNGAVLAFVDGFTTRLPDGRLRWELDLLGTRPEARGRGLGTALIRASTAAGRERGAAFARALIRQGNTASERAFARAGYAPDDHLLALYVQLEISERALAGMVAVPVTTMRYVGVWLEDAYDPQTGGRPELVAEMQGQRSEVIGVLVRQDDAAAHDVALAADFLPSGTFCWWRAISR